MLGKTGEQRKQRDIDATRRSIGRLSSSTYIFGKVRLSSVSLIFSYFKDCLLQSVQL